MGLSKLFLLLGIGVLAVCLVLSITTLQVLRNAIGENDLIQENAYALVGELSGCVRALNELSTPAIPVERETQEATEEVSAKTEGFWCRVAGDYVGIYNESGKLVKATEIRIDRLPASLREELKNGIYLASREEVLELLNDLES